mmetsp:Transcript_12268/g.40286  ORF Transcript_12268/g.40286 Transcript_12268/m.40286 type:complete len:274 (+) Transcript_12268:1317-2138(+)
MLGRLSSASSTSSKSPTLEASRPRSSSAGPEEEDDEASPVNAAASFAASRGGGCEVDGSAPSASGFAGAAAIPPLLLPPWTSPPLLFLLSCWCCCTVPSSSSSSSAASSTKSDEATRRFASAASRSPRVPEKRESLRGGPSSTSADGPATSAGNESAKKEAVVSRAMRPMLTSILWMPFRPSGTAPPPRMVLWPAFEVSGSPRGCIDGPGTRSRDESERPRGSARSLKRYKDGSAGERLRVTCSRSFEKKLRTPPAWKYNGGSATPLWSDITT